MDEQKPLGQIVVKVYPVAIGEDFEQFETNLYLNFKSQVESLIAEGIVPAPPDRRAKAIESVEAMLALVERPEYLPKLPARARPLTEAPPECVGKPVRPAGYPRVVHETPSEMWIE